MSSGKLFVKEMLTTESLLSFGKLLFITIIIALFFKILNIIAKRITEKRFSLQAQEITKKIIRYAGFCVIISTIFNRIGINLSAVLGAAGVAGIAVGFAAQTSISNIISGIFVMTERAIRLGDIIKVDNVTGTIKSLDLLSVTLQTFDNQYVRVPNEIIIKTNLINYSRESIRRIVIELTVESNSDLQKVQDVLIAAAEKSPYVLKKPIPTVLWSGFNNAGLQGALRVWAKNDDYMNVHNSVMIEVTEGLKKAGITIPFNVINLRIKENSCIENC